MTDESIKVTQIQSFFLHLRAFNTEYSTCDTKFSRESNKEGVLTAITTGHTEGTRSDDSLRLKYTLKYSRGPRSV